MHMRTPRPCADTHTHTHTLLCGYGLSTGPTDGLNSWWLRNRSLPDSQQQRQHLRRDIIHHLLVKINNSLMLSSKIGHFFTAVATADELRRLINCHAVAVIIIIITTFFNFIRPRALNIVLNKVELQRRVIGVKGVEEDDRISPLVGYWQLLKQKGGFSGFASD